MTDRCTHARFSSSNTRKSTTVMSGGLLSLKWNHHRSTFLHILRNVRQKELYSDVTIACDGKFYNAHKLVLATCSEYFEGMFEQTACKQPVIVLKDIGSEELEALLSYMYDGEVNVLQENLSSLIKAAECLRIKGLAVADSDPSSQSRSTTGSSSNRITDAKKSHHGSSSDSGSNKQNSSVNNTKESVLSNSNNRGIKRTHHSNTNSKDNEVLLKRRKDNVENGERFRNNDVSHHSDSNSSFAEGDNAAVKTEPVDVPDADDILHQFDDDNAPLPTEDTSNAETEDTHRNDAGESNQSDSNAPDFIEEKFDGASHGGGPEDDGDDTITGDPPSDAWRGAATSEDDADMFSPSDAGTSSFTGQPGNSLTLDNTASNSSSGLCLTMTSTNDDQEEYKNAITITPVGKRDSREEEEASNDAGSLLWPECVVQVACSDDEGNNTVQSGGVTLPETAALTPFALKAFAQLAQTCVTDFFSASCLTEDSHNSPAPPIHNTIASQPTPPSQPSLTPTHSSFPSQNIDYRRVSARQLDPQHFASSKSIPPDAASLVFPEPGRRGRRRAGEPPAPPFLDSCPYCGYKTKTKANLVTHIRRHTGEKRYICNHCGKRFVAKSELNMHLKIHTREKMFKCRHCRYMTPQNAKLRLHVEKRHCITLPPEPTEATC